MTDFIIKKLHYDLTSNAGLALVGQYTKRLGINAVVDRKFPVVVGGPNSDILKSYLGLLFHQFLGEQLEQAVLTNKDLRLLVISQQAVDQCVRDGHLFATPWECSGSLPIDRLHKNYYTPIVLLSSDIFQTSISCLY